MDSKTNKLDDEQSDDEFEEASEDDDAELFEMNLDELSRRIDNYFKIFDQHGNSTIEANELGNLIRCLRINAKQRLIKDIESQSMGSVRTPSISIEQLKPRLISCMQEDTLKPPNDKKVELAFKTIEEGYEPLTKERLEKCLTTQGEHFTAGEWNEMVNHLVVKKGGVIDWKAYIRDVMYIINKKS